MLFDLCARTDIELDKIEGEDRDAYEHDLRIWLLMIAYGARTKKGEKDPCNEKRVRRFYLCSCEAFSYRKETAV